MDLGSIFLFLGVALLVVLFIMRPLVEKGGAKVSTFDQTRSALLAERERVLDALEELDFDHRLGKIPEETYVEQRTNMLQKGAAILKDLDKVEAKIFSKRPRVSDDVERAIADRKAVSSAGPRRPVTADDDVERLIVQRRRERAERSGGFCPQCGQAIQQSDKFCSKCGAVLN